MLILIVALFIVFTLWSAIGFLVFVYYYEDTSPEWMENDLLYILFGIACGPFIWSVFLKWKIDDSRVPTARSVEQLRSTKDEHEEGGIG